VDVYALDVFTSILRNNPRALDPLHVLGHESEWPYVPAPPLDSPVAGDPAAAGSDGDGDGDGDAGKSKVVGEEKPPKSRSVFGWSGGVGMDRRLLEAAGGRPGVQALTDAFYTRVFKHKVGSACVYSMYYIYVMYIYIYIYIY
jgi:hypothetical protein